MRIVKNPQPNPDRDKALQELRAAYGDRDDLTEDEKRERFEKWEEINRKYPDPAPPCPMSSITSTMW